MWYLCIFIFFCIYLKQISGLSKGFQIHIVLALLGCSSVDDLIQHKIILDIIVRILCLFHKIIIFGCGLQFADLYELTTFREGKISINNIIVMSNISPSKFIWNPRCFWPFLLLNRKLLARRFKSFSKLTRLLPWSAVYSIWMLHALIVFV